MRYKYFLHRHTGYNLLLLIDDERWIYIYLYNIRIRGGGKTVFLRF